MPSRAPRRRGAAAHAPASAAAIAALLAACAVAAYAPLPVELPAGGLPADAFARCRDVLVARFAALAVADEPSFRLQTGWAAAAIDDRPAQRRATVFRHGDGIGLLVELRYLQFGWFDHEPTWSSPRPDRDGELELGRVLAAALR